MSTNVSPHPTSGGEDDKAGVDTSDIAEASLDEVGESQPSADADVVSDNEKLQKPSMSH